MSEHEATSDTGRDAVITLARAQMCFSVRTRQPQVAVSTMRMLEHYDDLHRSHHGDAEWLGRRRIASAHKDAEIASRSDRTVAFARCQRMRRSINPRARLTNGPYMNGIELPFSTAVTDITDNTRRLR